MTSIETIRSVETNILDQEFKKYKLVHRKQEEAIPHLLKVVGDFWRELPTYAPTEEALARPKFDTVLAGLGHCLRWIINSPPKHIRLPKVSHLELDQEAIELLGWGIRYHMLYLDHVAWSRGLLKTNVDETGKIIEFSLESDFDKQFYLAQLLDSNKVLNSLAERLPVEALKADFPLWKNHLRFDGSAIETAVSVTEFRTAYPAVIKWLEDVVLPEINGNEILNGYTLNEFRQFYASLFIHCEYWSWIEDYFDHRFGHEHELLSVA